MDTSEIYTKMCEKAEEIQEQSYTTKRDKQGLVYTLDVLRNWDEIYFTHEGDYCYVKKDGKLVVWLPRQDQLQEMVKPTEKGGQLEASFTAFCEWAGGDDKYCPVDFFTSWEQLWLAFVMKEKFAKKWNGKEWVI